MRETHVCDVVMYIGHTHTQELKLSLSAQFLHNLTAYIYS